MSGSYIPQPWNASDPVIVTSDMQAAPTKATPIDADGVILIDSAASNAIKRTLWSSLKDTLKTYFDTIYGSTVRSLPSGGTTGQALAKSTNDDYEVEWVTVSGGSSLTVTEVDGSPSLTATTLRFPNGTVTDAGGGIAALSVLPSSVTKAELNAAVSDGDVVFVGDGLNGTLGATTPAAVVCTTDRINANGAASTPASALVGTWFTGGTATTTKPHLLIEPTGTTSTNWATGGTSFGINAVTGFGGNFIDCQINGSVSRFAVSSLGIASAAGLVMTDPFRRARFDTVVMRYQTAGLLELMNPAETLNTSLACLNIAASGTVSTSANGAASTPPVLLTGTWFTGGTSTTTKPQLLVEPTGTTSTGWNTAGTAIGVNSGSSFAGYLLDLQKNGVTKLSVDTNGTLLSAFGVTAAGSIGAGTGFYSNVGLGVQSSNTSVKLANNGALSSANTFAALVTNNSAMTQTSGSNGCLQITPTYNQTSGTAANTDLLINRTQTAVGSGSQLLIDAQVGSISKFKVDNNGGLTASGTVTVGSGTAITRVLSATATLDFPSIASNDTHTLTITVTGAVAGDSVFLGCPAGLDAGLIFCASVTATNTVTVRMHNSSGGSTDPASATFRATVMQF